MGKKIHIGTNHPPTRQFRDWLSILVSNGTPGDMIPTEYEIARQFSISRTTVHHEVARLAREGLVTRTRRTGTVIGKAQQIVPLLKVVPRKPRSWEMIAAWIREQIERGRIRVGNALPPAKTISGRFAVTSATVTTACQRLEADGLIRKVGKRYWVSRVGSDELRPAVREVLYINWSDKVLHPHTDVNQLARACDQMESELLRYGFRLRREPPDRFREICLSARRTARMPEGFAMFHVWDRAVYKEIIAALRDCAKVLHRPVPRTFFLTGILPITTKTVHFIHHGTFDTAVARMCTEYCFQNQISRVAVFLRDIPGSVGAYTKMWPELDRLNPNAEIDFVVDTHGNTARQLGAVNAESIMGHKGFRTAGKYRPVTGQELFRRIRFVDSFEEYYPSAQQVSTWIFPGENDAVEAKRWARNHGMAIPRDLSILSLRDSLEVQNAGISVCAPDWEDAGYIMAHAVIGDIAVEKSRRGSLRVKAVFRHRQTTR